MLNGEPLPRHSTLNIQHSTFNISPLTFALSTTRRIDRMPRSRGFSLAETLVALAILAIVITTTIAMFAERTRRLREANETILAFQALSNEAEYWRRESFT